MGSEVKSIRQGRVNLRDGYALIKDGELWLHKRAHFSLHHDQQGL
jgi:SsrA-binding protein